MNSEFDNKLRSEIAQRVRGNFIYAAIGGALLIYFGWFGGAWNWDVETWSGRGVWLIMVAMRAGGILMGLAALFCLTGAPWALLLDSLTTLAVGVSLTLGALLFFQGGGTNALLYLILGIFLSNSGYRNWQEYRALVALSAAGRRHEAREISPSSALPASPATPSQHTLDRLATVKHESVAPAPELPPRRELATPSTPPPPPPDGYLAAFGRDEPDEKHG